MMSQEPRTLYRTLSADQEKRPELTELWGSVTFLIFFNFHYPIPQ